MARQRILAVDQGGGRGSETQRRRFRHWLHAWEPTYLVLFRPWEGGVGALAGYLEDLPADGRGSPAILRKAEGRESGVPLERGATGGPGALAFAGPGFDLRILHPAPGAGESRLAPPGVAGRADIAVCDAHDLAGRLAALGWVEVLTARAGREAGAGGPRLFCDPRTAAAADTCAVATADGCEGPFRHAPRPAALLEFGPDEYFDELVVNPFATAVRRPGPSPMVRGLVAAGILSRGMRVLDWGCGHGEDVAWLRRRGIAAEGFDPAPGLGRARFPAGRFDAALLTRVVDVIALEKERIHTVRQAMEFLRPGGLLYVAARREPAARSADGAERWEPFSDGRLWRARRRFHKGFTNGSLRALLAAAVSGDVSAPFPAPFAHALVRGARPAVLSLEVARPRRPVTFVDTPAGLARLAAALAKERAFGLDVETTIYEIPRRLCTIQCATAARIWIVDALALAPADLAPFGALLADPRVAKVIHNARFETSMFRPYGFALRNVFDTMVASRMVDGRDPEYGHSLSGVCRRLLGMDVDKTQQTSSWTVRPLSRGQVDYAALDAEVLVELHAKFAGRYAGGPLFT